MTPLTRGHFFVYQETPLYSGLCGEEVIGQILGDTILFIVGEGVEEEGAGGVAAEIF